MWKSHSASGMASLLGFDIENLTLRVEYGNAHFEDRVTVGLELEKIQGGITSDLFS